MANTSIVRFGSAFLLILLLAASAGVPAAHAATRTNRTNPYFNYWTGTSEGGVSSTTLDRGTSRRGMSSAMMKAIAALDKDPVEQLPIPVLLGVPLSSISPNFGDPRDGGARTHEGEDILAPLDDYIVSPTDAVVTSTGNGVSAGNYVYTANPGGETYAYMHLDKFAKNLKVGTVLTEGDLIGYVGNTGDAAGGPTHLHFEIRDGKTATDPFPRLAREFTLSERIDAVTTALKGADDEDADAQTLVANYRPTFLAARAAGTKLPSSIEDALGKPAVITSGSFARDLTIGSRGDDVAALQQILIASASGPQASALATAGATGYFGALTQAALAEYQAAHGISPAAGYFGPLTRARIVA
ncbi:MAG: peptidoglycan DD-metalloendopeptidase family protein [Patescibacteria group bacterium]